MKNETVDVNQIFWRWYWLQEPIIFIIRQTVIPCNCYNIREKSSQVDQMFLDVTTVSLRKQLKWDSYYFKQREFVWEDNK